MKYKSRNKSRQATERLYQYKMKRGLRCAICGYNKNHAALIFHHLNEDTKLIDIASYARKRRGWKRVEEELTKCILICHNCHSELHYPQANLLFPFRKVLGREEGRLTIKRRGDSGWRLMYWTVNQGMNFISI